MGEKLTFSFPVSMTNLWPFDLKFALPVTYVQGHVSVNFEILRLSDFE